MKAEIKGYIFASTPESWDKGDSNVIDNIKYNFFVYPFMQGNKYTKVCAHTLTFDIPDGFSIQENVLQQLERQKINIKEAYDHQIDALNKQIDTLKVK